MRAAAGRSKAFRPAWWLPGGHLPTIWANRVGRRRPVALRNERLELPDGDFVDLAWHDSGDGPCVLILHGLEGSSRSAYVMRLIRAFARRGWSSLVMHFRGCSGEPNRLARSYHSGDTQDPRYLMQWLTARDPGRPLAAVGFSMGGNVLLKLLGEAPGERRLRAAVAVSVPFDLKACAHRINRGFSRVYQWRFLRSLRRRVRQKFDGRAAPFALDQLDELRDFIAFDNHVTAPLNGFDSAIDYYHRSSSHQYLANIDTPTLIIQSRDDPLLDAATIPARTALPPAVELEVHARGGHVGFVEGAVPGYASYYLERRIPEYLDVHLNLEAAVAADLMSECVTT